MSARIINIQITENEVTSFFQSYRDLGTLQRKIVRILHWYSKNFASVFPSQEKIALLAGCSRKHVNETLAKLQSLGWVSLISRGLARTKRLILAPFLRILDFQKCDTFHRREVTSEVTHNSNSVSERTLSESTESCVTNSANSGPPKQPKVNVIEIPERIQKLKMTLRQKLKFALMPSCILDYANRVTKSRLSDQEKELINDPHKYAFEVALKKSQENNEKLHWRSYYHTVQHYQAQGINVDE